MHDPTAQTAADGQVHQFTDPRTGDVYVVRREDNAWTVVPDRGRPGISGIVADDACAAWRHFRATYEDSADPIDQFVVLRGGLIDNRPALPVFDLDVLSCDVRDDTWVDDLIDLAASIMRHPAAAAVLREDLLRIESHVVRHGTIAQTARLREVWRTARTTDTTTKKE